MDFRGFFRVKDSHVIVYILFFWGVGILGVCVCFPFGIHMWRVVP